MFACDGMKHKSDVRYLIDDKFAEQPFWGSATEEEDEFYQVTPNDPKMCLSSWLASDLLFSSNFNQSAYAT